MGFWRSCFSDFAGLLRRPEALLKYLGSFLGAFGRPKWVVPAGSHSFQDPQRAKRALEGSQGQILVDLGDAFWMILWIFNLDFVTFQRILGGNFHRGFPLTCGANPCHFAGLADQPVGGTVFSGFSRLACKTWLLDVNIGFLDFQIGLLWFSGSPWLDFEAILRYKSDVFLGMLFEISIWVIFGLIFDKIDSEKHIDVMCCFAYFVVFF